MNKSKIFICIAIGLLVIVAVGIFLFQQQSIDELPIRIVVESNGKTEYIDVWNDKNDEDEYYVFIPSYSSLETAKISLDTDTTVKLGDVELQDGMKCESFLTDTQYILTCSSFFKKYEYHLTFISSAGVPTMYVDTESGSMEYIHGKKGNDESGNLRIYTADGSIDYVGDIKSINGRGNYTWRNSDKKPYSVTLSSEGDLLGMGQAQKWILLSNASDMSGIRNKMIYDFSDDFGLLYSPDSCWVDLYLNGEYVGLYLLCERNEIHTERIDISNESILVSMELKEKLDADGISYITTQTNQNFRVHSPDVPTDQKWKEISGILQQVENAIVAEDGIDPTSGKHFTELIDMDSWARKYLIEEAFGNHDAGYISQYFYIDESNSSKLVAGPVWDYDLAIGNPSAWQIVEPKSFLADRPETSPISGPTWFSFLCSKKEFREAVLEIYQSEFLPRLEKFMDEELVEYCEQISVASKMNDARWSVGENDTLASTQYIQTYLDERTAFLSSAWIDGSEYCRVRVDQGFNISYIYYAVLPGQCLTALPTLEDTENSTFLGWYYVDTDEPFDESRPITEDIQVYAKWKDSTSNSMDNVVKLIPLGVIAVMFVVIFLVAINRIKRERVTKDERK